MDLDNAPHQFGKTADILKAQPKATDRVSEIQTFNIMSIDSDQAFVKKDQFDILQKQLSTQSQELSSKQKNMDDLQSQLNKKLAKAKQVQQNQVQTFNILSIGND